MLRAVDRKQLPTAALQTGTKFDFWMTTEGKKATVRVGIFTDWPAAISSQIPFHEQHHRLGQTPAVLELHAVPRAKNRTRSLGDLIHSR